MMHLIFSKFWFSFWQSLVTVGLCLGLGGGLALTEYYLKTKSSKLFNGLMAVPVFLPSLVVATGFIMIWGNAGLVNDFLLWLGFNKIKFLYSPTAIIAAHCFYNIPLAYLAINIRLASSHSYLEEAAQVMSASLLIKFKTITWPRIKNSVIGIGLVIFLYSFLSFAIPLVLGGVRYQTLEVYIYNLMTQQLSFSAAAWLSVLQFASLLILILIFIKFLKSITEQKIRKINNNKKNNLLVYMFRIILGLYVGAPIAAILYKGYVSMNLKILIEFGLINALFRSFWLALVSVLLCVIICLFILFYRTKLGKYLIILLAISPVMLGVLFLLLFNKSFYVMILAYIILLLPLSYYLLANTWQSKPKYFLDSLKILGANKTQKIKAYILYLMPALTKVTALGSAMVIGDIAIAALLSPYQQPTAMGLSYSLLGNYRFTLASSAMSLVLISIFVIILLIYILTYKYDFERKQSNS